MTERQLQTLRRRLIRNCERAEDVQNRLQGALESCARTASAILGFEVIADMCSGTEIEFRRVDGDRPDDFSCIRLEDVLDVDVNEDCLEEMEWD